MLKEVDSGVDLEQDVLAGMQFRPIIETVASIDEQVFLDDPLTFPNFAQSFMRLVKLKERVNERCEYRCLPKK